MKILQVNVVYKKGSTGKITHDLHKGLLDAGMESIVCYGRGELVNEPGVYKTCPEWYSKLNNALSRVTGIMYGGCFFSTNKLISIIKKEQPDIVHLQCINGYFVNIYRLVNWLKKNHIKTVLTLHAEFMYTGGCGHSIECDQWSTREGCGHSGCPRWRSETKSLFADRTAAMWHKMKDAFDGFEELTVVSVSPWLMERAQRAPILAGKKHCVIYNGLDTGVFHPYDTQDLREKHHCGDKKVVFHATPYFSADPNHLKGGYYVLELAKQMPDAVFIVAGEPEKAIQVPPNVILLGRVASQELLARYYSMADVTLLTSKRETFSMVTAESLCCGTPVVGFKAGAPEQIAIPEYSRFVEQGDISALRACTNGFLAEPVDDALSAVAKDKYSIQTAISRHILLYTDFIGEKR